MMRRNHLRFCAMLIALLLVGVTTTFAQQTMQVKGTVVDKATGESVIGASVIEEGADSNGTITDIDGNFTLTVASGASLTITYSSFGFRFYAARA